MRIMFRGMENREIRTARVVNTRLLSRHRPTGDCPDRGGTYPLRGENQATCGAFWRYLLVLPLVMAVSTFSSVYIRLELEKAGANA